MPQSRYENQRSLPLNRHGAGPFCRFQIPSGWNAAGLYALTLDVEVVYVGKCDTPLSVRFGPRGYGVIHPRNCYRGGQSTNCRINSLILQRAKLGQMPELWFHQEADNETLRLLEKRLIVSNQPRWNIQR